jgi:hypothetical protein
MAGNGNQDRTELIVRKGEALVAVPGEKNGEPVMCIYVRNLRSPGNQDEESFALPLSAIGAWKERCGDEELAELDSLTHDDDPGSGIGASVRAKVVRSLAGAWSDLDWDEMVEAIDRSRKERKTTP